MFLQQFPPKKGVYCFLVLAQRASDNVVPAWMVESSAQGCESFASCRLGPGFLPGRQICLCLQWGRELRICPL